MISTLQIKKNELGGARSTYGGDETYQNPVHTGFWWGSLK